MGRDDDAPVPAGCEITISTTHRQAPPGGMFSAMPGIRPYHEVPVRGTEGFATEQHGEVFLDWQEAPGVVGSLRCAGGVDAAVQIADSLAEVDLGDPRVVIISPG